MYEELISQALVSPDVARIVVMLIVLLFSVVIHEVAHGLVALWRGDPTAQMLGRLTLNPVEHIDPMMSILLPVVLLVMSNGTFAFGAAKPVPVNYFNLRNPKRDMMLVSIAGPGSNILLAIGFMILFRVLVAFGVPSMYLDFVGFAALLNVFLAVFNMIPIPPLDGSKVLMGILPDSQADALRSIEPYGMFILIALLMTGALSGVFRWVAVPLMELIREVVFLI